MLSHESQHIGSMLLTGTCVQVQPSPCALELCLQMCDSCWTSFLSYTQVILDTRWYAGAMPAYCLCSRHIQPGRQRACSTMSVSLWGKLWGSALVCRRTGSSTCSISENCTTSPIGWQTLHLCVQHYTSASTAKYQSQGHDDLRQHVIKQRREWCWWMSKQEEARAG